MKTLHFRIKQQNESALRVARYLESHPRIAKGLLSRPAIYPGLPSNEGHKIARRQMAGFGVVFSFALRGDFDAVKGFLPRLQLVNLAANLGAGGNRSAPPATTNHVESTAEEREAVGIPEGLICYSVGIDDMEDLVADLEQALES